MLQTEGLPQAMANLVEPEEIIRINPVVLVLATMASVVPSMVSLVEEVVIRPRMFVMVVSVVVPTIPVPTRSRPLLRFRSLLGCYR